MPGCGVSAGAGEGLVSSFEFLVEEFSKTVSTVCEVCGVECLCIHEQQDSTK